MEVKIPKEIRDYQESIFFGLSARQFIFSLLAILVAIGVYFLLREPLGFETVSWVCILCAAPFAAMGFFSYNGLNFEQFVSVWVRSEMMSPRHLPFIAENYYEIAMRPKHQKGQKQK
jgi:hypothetical protein